MNITKLKSLFLLLLAVAAISCGDKDDPAPAQDLKELELTIFEESQKIAVPEGLQSSSDPYAQQVNSMISSISVNSYSAMFTVPDGATQLSEPIEAANGRTNGSSVTWEWSYQGGSIAYQITELDDSYFFEMFFKTDGEPYYKWFEGEQSKDGRSGSFLILDHTSDTRTVLLTYNYEIRADGSFYLEYISFTQTLKIEVAADKSGSISQFNGASIMYEYTWAADGSGTWTEYDETGAVVEEGSWTAG